MEDGIKPRSGSFLPKVVPIRKPYRRNGEIERAVIRRQIRDFEILSNRLLQTEQEIRDIVQYAETKERSERFEMFVTYLLRLLYERGDVTEYGWHKMYAEGYKIDNLGLDQWCVLSESNGSLFCFIDTKSSHGRVRAQQKGWRGDIVYPFYPEVDPKDGVSKKEAFAIADKLLSELIAFFGTGNGNGRRNGRG
ncbi:MAG: hypothetical protein G01um101429_836 [Parcubacteria group bacterium Gr01-1014_29]|nr:MAG: hypothetical protein G01um101429_836 [Parcubacteria group bacterium Gr01-1014_29]